MCVFPSHSFRITVYGFRFEMGDQPGSHRRNVTQEFFSVSSSHLMRCWPCLPFSFFKARMKGRCAKCCDAVLVVWQKPICNVLSYWFFGKEKTETNCCVAKASMHSAQVVCSSPERRLGRISSTRQLGTRWPLSKTWANTTRTALSRSMLCSTLRLCCCDYWVNTSPRNISGELVQGHLLQARLHERRGGNTGKTLPPLTAYTSYPSTSMYAGITRGGVLTLAGYCS